jgi:hypothetical protein
VSAVARILSPVWKSYPTHRNELILYTFKNKAKSVCCFLFIDSVDTVLHLDMLRAVPVTAVDIELDYYVMAQTCTKEEK